MASNSEFLAPRLEGKRFEDHTIPLELFEDFAALEQLLNEVAKWLYLNENPVRKRVPNKFSENIELKLAGIGEGSAIPKIILAAVSSGLFPNENIKYFEEAKDRVVNSIVAAQNNGNITNYIPEQFLGYFNQFGKRLKEDESIDFSNGAPDVKFTNEIRKRLVLASSQIYEVTNQVTITGKIVEADKGKKSFTILLSDEKRVISSIPTKHIDAIMEAFNGYEMNYKVSITGIGKFNKEDKLTGFESIEDISIIDPLDISSRLEELSFLQDGWLDGEGSSINKEHLSQFASNFQNNYSSDLPLPYLFPTIEGGIQAEWETGYYMLTVKFNLEDSLGMIQSLNLKSDEVEEMHMDVKSVEDWNKLNEIIYKILNSKGDE